MRGLLAVLLLSGCGGLSPEFAGTWTGTLVFTLTSPSSTPVTQSTAGAQQVIEDDGASGLFALVCADKSGRLKLEGGGTHATWTGVQSCPAPTTGCAGASLIFRHVTADVSTGSLKAVATGTGADCAYTFDATYEFNGTK
jgi:hypothetical protein